MPPSPQLENGYLRIATELAEALARVNLAPYESRVLWFVLRKTYGYGKKIDRVSLSQFASGTQIKPQHARRAIKSLIARQILMTEKEGPQRVLYGLQKDYQRWGEPLPIQGVPIEGDPVQGVPNQVQTSPCAGNKPLPMQGDTKDKKIKTKDSDPSFPAIEGIIRHLNLPLIAGRTIHRLNELSGKSYKTNSTTVAKYLLARLKDGASEDDVLAVVEDRWRRWGQDEKMREHYNPTTLFRESNFERYLTEAKAATASDHEIVIKDLGDGMFEIDGRRIHRDDYRRRYGKEPKPTA